MANLDTYLETMLPYSQSMFPSQENIERIRHIAGLFPSALSRCIVLESRLHPLDRNSDFLLCITKTERGKFIEWLAENQTIFEQKSFDQLSKLIRLWSSAGSALSEKIEMVWLEFDIPNDPQSFLVPGLFIGSREFPACGQKSQLDASWVLTEALPGLVGDGWSHYKPMVKHTIGCLPEDARLFQMGIFTGRENSPLRLCLTRIPAESIVTYLKKIGYPSDLTVLKDVIHNLAPLCELHLDIDVSSDLDLKIGLECSQPFDLSTELSPGKTRLLDFLVEIGLCSPAHRETIQAFPGVAVIPDIPGAFLDAQVEVKAGLHNRSMNTIQRDLMHIKLVYRPEYPVEAKAYFQGFQSTMSDLEFVKRKLFYQARQKSPRVHQSTSDPSLV